jgi:hypothetical protein
VIFLRKLAKASIMAYKGTHLVTIHGNYSQNQLPSITMLSGVVTDSCKFAAAAIAEAG